MASIFTKIVQKEIPCHLVAESDQYLAFLDINPISEGHTLVIPKVEIDYFFDLDDDVMSGLMSFAKKVAKGLDKTVECKRVGVLVEGLEVPHAHVHLIPIQGTMFPKNRPKYSQEELAAIAQRIRTTLVD